jgi:cell division protein FtsB
MVTRPRLRSILASFGLYAMAALLIGYFAINAYGGKHGLKAKQALDAEITELTTNLTTARAERTRWERRVALLKSDRIDPDTLEERARALLGYIDPRDVVILTRER